MTLQQALGYLTETFITTLSDHYELFGAPIQAK
jgi:hypothetical protein